jgi:hypothetical protein
MFCSIFIKCLHIFPLSSLPLLRLVMIIFRFDVSCFKPIPDLLPDCCNFLFCSDSLSNQLSFILAGYWSHLIYNFVHERLGERWLIQLIMSHLSITNKINNDIVIKFLSIFSCCFECMMNGLHIICINVEDRS